MSNSPANRVSNSTLSEWVRRAAAEPGTVLLHTARADAENRTSLLFSDPLQILIANEPEAIPGVFAAAEQALQNGCSVAGFMSYEAGYHFEPAALRGAELAAAELPLIWFGVYRSPLLLDATEQGSAGLRSHQAALLHTGELPQDLEIGISPAEYGKAIDTIREYIAAGDLYQSNFTLPLSQRWEVDAALLFEHMMRNQPVPFGALVHAGDAHVLSASPELFFRRTGHEIVVRPMKGTAPRGRDLREDAERAAWLAADEKNRAENVMIVDMLRNDLGRVCTAGSVRVTDLFAVERYPDLLQMTSTVRGELHAEATYYDIFRSLFPCGSITGAPKVRTMQVIRELEHAPRGIACGALGYMAPHGEAVFSVAIRTVTLAKGELHMRVGSGVTYDSQAESEYAECLLKSSFLTRRATSFELIETMLWNGRYFLLDLHMERLADSAAYFAFHFDPAAIRLQLHAYASAFSHASRHRVRLLLAPDGNVSLTSQPIVATGRSVSLVLSAERVHSHDRFLRHKTTHRALYDRALADAHARGYDDALFLNERDEITECAIHNVMIFKGGRWMTPPADCGLLPGVYRRFLLDQHPRIEQRVLHLDDLRTADRVFVFNSVRGLRRVRTIAGLDTL